MMPMQPIGPLRPTNQRPQLPGMLKALLGLKAVACVVVLFLTMTTASAINAAVARERVGDGGREAIHAMGQLLSLIAGAQLLQLIGIAGTWSLKRWGVYILAMLAMLDVVLNLKAQNNAVLVLGLITSLIVAVGVATRWNDFE